MNRIKNYLILFLLGAILPLSTVVAQNTFPANGNVGIGTSSPHSSAALEVKSTSKGVLIPRMTKSQRDGINSPATGLLIYQTNNDAGFYYYTGTTWSSLSGSSGPVNANKTLSNLTAPTSVNVDLLPATGSISLGSSVSSWKNLNLNGDIFVDGNRVLTFPTPTNGFSGNFSGNPTASGVENTGIGYSTLYFLTSGNYNTATGSYALSFNTIGEHNTATGRASLYYNTSGNENTAVGAYTLYSNTSGTDNTAVGISSLYSNTFGFGNSALGYRTLYTNTSGHYNTAMGYDALQWNTDAQYNTAIGAGAAYLFTMGWNNTMIGAEADANGSGYYNAIALGQAATVTGVNMARIGNSFTSSIGGYVNWTNISDGRYKKNVREDVKGLDFINKLRPVTYNLDVTGISKKLNEDRGRELNDEQKNSISEKEKVIYSGFIAQEVETAANETKYDFSGVDKPKNENDLYGLRYAEFVVPLVKAVQELSKQNDDLQKQIDELKSKMELSEVSDYTEEAGTLSSATLEQNVPNPFRQQTTIRYTIPSNYHSAILQISDMKGNILKSWSINQVGKGELTIRGEELQSGVYQNTLIVDGKKIDTKQMVITK